MPSLLDFIIQNQRPQSGLLGAGGTPPQANPLGAMVGVQQAAEGGAAPSRIPASADSLLTDEDRQALRQQNLLHAGLGILSADPGQSDIGRIAQGIMLSSELGREAKQDLVKQRVGMQELAIKLREEQQEDRKRILRGKLFANADLTDPQQRTELMEKLMAAGDFEGADRLNTFESNMPEAELVENGNEMIVFDPRTLEEKGRIETPDERPEGTELVNRGTRSDLIDSNTGEVIATFSHGLSPSELRERQNTIFSRTDKLADDFRSETSGLQGALRLAEAAEEAPSQDPAAQQTLVIALNKLLDPTSVVRQSEFARVQEIGGFTAEAQTLANRLMEEGQLPPEVEKRIRDEIARLAKQKEAQLRDVAEQYVDRAEQFGVNPRYVVRRGLQPNAEEEDEEEEDELDTILDRNLPGGGGN